MSEEKLLTKLSDLRNIFRERDEKSGRVPKQQTLPRGVVLPAGWESARAPNGRTYFFHRSTGKSQWDPPIVGRLKTSSRIPSPSRLGNVADVLLQHRKDKKDTTTTTTALVVKKTSTSPASTFPKPHVDIASSFFSSPSSSTRSVGKYYNVRHPVDKKKIKRTPREPPKLALIYRRQSIRHQKQKKKNGVVVADYDDDEKESKEDFSGYSNDALEKEYRRQLETERTLLRKAAMLRKELQRPKNVFDGKNPFLSPKHGEESQEYIRLETSEARKRRVRIYEVMMKRRGNSSIGEKTAQDSKIENKTLSMTPSAAVVTNKVQTKPVLPKGWNMTIDPSSGRPYYYHAETGDSSWNPPGADDDGKDDKALPAGWARSTTRDGRKYYYNSVTCKVQWEFPIAHIATAEAEAHDDDDVTGSARHVRIEIFLSLSLSLPLFLTNF